MPKFQLISFETCPWVQRAAIVLREKGVDFALEHIDRDDRPAWFLAISPHKKVPVLRIDDRVSLFESNAIAEYLDETLAPRLRPHDPILCAVNRAWTDYVPTFASLTTGVAYAETEADYERRAAGVSEAFARLEGALAGQNAGPFFNGSDYSLVDAAYAPFLQRYAFLDRVRRLGCIERFPRVQAWSQALLERPSTHTFPPEVFERLYLGVLKRRGGYLGARVDPSAITGDEGSRFALS